MPSRYLLAAFAAASLLSLLSSCSSAPSGPKDLLDENTGVTLNAVAKPLLFARVRTDAGGSHDYVTVVTVEKDNAGKFTDLFLMYRWSIAFHGESAKPQPGEGRILIQADDHEIELQPLDSIPLDLSKSKALFVPESAEYVAYAYAADFATMRQIASSHELTLRLPQDLPQTPFWLWGDGRAALAQLVQQLAGS